MKTMKIFSLETYTLYDMSYGTAQIQLHTCAHILVCLHMCINMLPITCDGVLVSLITVHMCYTRGCTHACVTRVDTNLLLACTCVTLVYV